MRGLTARWAGPLMWEMGGRKGGTLWEQELTDLAWKASVIFLFIICCPFFCLIVLCRFDVYCTTDFEAIQMEPPKSIGIHSYYSQDFCCSQSQTLARLRGRGGCSHRFKHSSPPEITPAGLAIKYWSESRCHHCGSLIILRRGEYQPGRSAKGVRRYSAALR